MRVHRTDPKGIRSLQRNRGDSSFNFYADTYLFYGDYFFAYGSTAAEAKRNLQKEIRAQYEGEPLWLSTQHTNAYWRRVYEKEDQQELESLKTGEHPKEEGSC